MYCGVDVVVDFRFSNSGEDDTGDLVVVWFNMVT